MENYNRQNKYIVERAKSILRILNGTDEELEKKINEVLENLYQNDNRIILTKFDYIDFTVSASCFLLSIK